MARGSASPFVIVLTAEEHRELENGSARPIRPRTLR